MARSTGPLIAVGVITVVNQSVFNDKPVDWRVPIAAGGAAMIFSLAEKAMPDFIPMVAWIALVGVLLSRVDPAIPSPAESFLDWWEEA